MDILSDNNAIQKYYVDIMRDKSSRYARTEEILPKLDEESVILDYGCGTGIMSHFFSQKLGCRVEGIDISKEEVMKAQNAWNREGRYGPEFMSLDTFNFPSNYYDLIFSSQVIEHVHNVGNYLMRINKMLKINGYLIIGTPNICNPRFNTETLLFSNKRAVKLSEFILSSYDKKNTHINSWDPSHLVRLLASMGFLLEAWQPLEGVPHTFETNRLPLIGKWIPKYTNKMNKTRWGRRCYTMQFRFRKVKTVEISQFD